MTYENPVFPGYFADPFVFRHEGLFYAVGTGPSAAGEADDRIFPMLKSADLVHWEPQARALIRPDASFGSDFWAPEVAYTEGFFWMYYSVGAGHLFHHLRVARSERPEGPYDDVAALTSPDKVPFAIDGHPFQDEDGQWYLYYAIDFLDSENGYRPGTALVVDRLATMTQLAGEPRTVLRATQEWQRYEADRKFYDSVYDWHTLEGPTVVKRQGRYWCLYSGGNFQNETYGVDYCVADHPLGPFSGGEVEIPRLLKSVPGKVRGPGHNSVIAGPGGLDFMVYHAWNEAMTERQMCIDPLRWTEDGPVCNGPTWTPQTI